jgi:hypothetical protein
MSAGVSTPSMVRRLVESVARQTAESAQLVTSLRPPGSTSTPSNRPRLGIRGGRRMPLAGAVAVPGRRSSVDVRDEEDVLIGIVAHRFGRAEVHADPDPEGAGTRIG